MTIINHNKETIGTTQKKPNKIGMLDVIVWEPTATTTNVKSNNNKIMICLGSSFIPLSPTNYGLLK